MNQLVLVGTFVWIGHLKNGNEQLKKVLSEDQVLVHPFVIGELALGQLKHREEILSLMKLLQQVLAAKDDEVMSLIENHKL